MAKAREIAGLDPASSFADVARRAVQTRAEEVLEHSTGVLDASEVEHLHDMRVATRRLRAALEIFEPCFSERALRRTLAEVKELADALGERRDRDVAIASLEAFAAEMPRPDQRGVRTLIERFQAEQLQANRELEPHLDRERLAALRRTLSRLVGSEA